jgi:hypothetical protein
MKAKLAEEFYSMVEYLKTKDIGDFAADILDRDLGCLYDYTESCLYHDNPEKYFWEVYVAMRLEEMMFKYGELEVCSFEPDQEKLKAIVNGD